MKFAKYLLSQTGLFPKYKPNVSDVLNAATLVRDIQHLHNIRGAWHWYIWPRNWNAKYLIRIVRLFNANGVLLRPHYSHYFQEWVLSAGNMNQQFMRDVRDIYNDTSNFEKIMDRNVANAAPHKGKIEATQRVFNRSR